jgi:sarcosine oxidase
VVADVEFAVIGAGMAGLATARCLALAGREVVVFEQFCVGHGRGSSHGASRIFRLSYPDARYVRLAMQAFPMWRELEREVGEHLLVPTGGLDCGAPLAEHEAALAACGARYEMLDGSQAAARWPALSFAPEETVLYQADAALTRADAALRALLRSATEHGATVREETHVRALRGRGERVVMDTTIGTWTCSVAVVAAGGWARPLLAAAGIHIPVVATRQTVAYFEIPGAERLPPLVDWREPIFYALASPGQGLKAGIHHSGPETDPDEPGVVDPATVDLVAERVARRYPGAEARPHHTETCIYTSTSDEHLILERRGRIVIGSACSGHGFKFAPLTGRTLADLAIAG